MLAQHPYNLSLFGRNEDGLVQKIRVKSSAFGLSDVGLVREKNEDVWKALPEWQLFVVADGMGGHVGGKVAAEESVGLLCSMAREIEAEGMDSVIKRVNEKVFRIAQREPELLGMGTTLCVLFFSGSDAIYGHVGDSRIYFFRKKKLIQLTKDDSLISELLSLGEINLEEVAASPYRHILTKAIGTHSMVEPTVGHLEIAGGDLFLLCTDGLTNYANSSEIEQILSQNTPIERKGYLLVDLAKKHGGGDNITVLLVQVNEIQ